MNNRTIAVVNILFGNRPGTALVSKWIIVSIAYKKILFPFLLEKSNAQKYLENKEVNL